MALCAKEPERSCLTSRMGGEKLISGYSIPVGGKALRKIQRRLKDTKVGAKKKVEETYSKVSMFSKSDFGGEEQKKAGKEDETEAEER